MPSSQPTQVGHQKSHHIPTYLPLPDAAKKYGLSEKALTQLIQTGKIEAVQLPTGELLVAAENNGSPPKTKEQIIAEEFAHLRGQWITVSQASTKYKVLGRTIREWIALKYIQTTTDIYPMKLNEAEVAYCAKVHNERKVTGSRSGVPLLDKNGQPYRLRHPGLSEYRRRKRHEHQEAK